MAEKKTKERRQDEIAKKLGDLLNTAVAAYTEELPHSFKRTGDYIVTVAVERAEGKYRAQDNGETDWEDPEMYGMMHFAVIIQDRDDKRFVPNLDVSVRVYDKDYKLVTESEAPFQWHPFAFHYGFDTALPDDGTYSVEVTINAPKFDRFHTLHGKRYEESITAKLGPLDIILPGGEGEGDIAME